MTGYDVVTSDHEELRNRWGFERVTDDLAGAVGDADFVSLHVPLLPSTRGMVDGAFLARLRQDAWLINTSRGEILDESALYDVLASDRLAGAALDVARREPYAPESPSRDLRRLQNVIFTPHVGSSTVEASQRMGRAALDNIRAVVEERWSDLRLVNPGVLAKA